MPSKTGLAKILFSGLTILCLALSCASYSSEVESDGIFTANQVWFIFAGGTAGAETQKNDYRKDTEPLYHSLMYSLVHITYFMANKLPITHWPHSKDFHCVFVFLLIIGKIEFLFFCCWLAAWRSSYKRNPWQLNHFNIKTLLPATALASSFTTSFTIYTLKMTIVYCHKHVSHLFCKDLYCKDTEHEWFYLQRYHLNVFFHSYSNVCF